MFNVIQRHCGDRYNVHVQPEHPFGEERIVVKYTTGFGAAIGRRPVQGAIRSPVLSVWSGVAKRSDRFREPFKEAS